MIVEVLDRRAGVRQRVRLRAFPASIGRGYDNDVILDDRYADARHARVEWDGQGGLVLIDQGSVNGLQDPMTGQRSWQVPVRAGLEVRIGRTVLRFVDPAAALEPALRLETGAEGGGAESRPLRAVAVILGTGLLLGLNTWLGKTDRVRLSGLLGDALVALLMVMVWAGAWALVNRITQHRFRFLEHMYIPCVVLAGFILATGGEEWLSFLVPNGVGWGTLAGILVLGLATWGLAAHLARVAAISRPAQWLWSLGIIGALSGVAYLSADGDRHDFGGASGDTPLKPVSARLIPTTTPEAFLIRVDGLKTEVDELGDTPDDGAVEPEEE